jgi:tRNA (cmo5U34)-methyltransferase
MSEFGESAWARDDFSRNYLERADVYIVERRKMFALAASFCGHFFKDKTGVRLLDLGAGDGALSHELLKTDGSISATLVDGSEAMLRRADERLGEYENVKFVRASFQELLRGAAALDEEFDLAVSSLAIHHLSTEEKAALYGYVYGHLSEGGGFLNMDVVLAPSEGLEEWYFARWRGWMEHMQARLGLGDESPEDIIRRYKEPASTNRPDTLENQLDALRKAGFGGVDCYFKDGIFAAFGGRKV